MAAGVPHLRGLQQHHEKEQGALRHDRRGGAEAQEAEEERLKDRHRGSIFRVGKCSPCVIHRNHYSFSGRLKDFSIPVSVNCDTAGL